MRNPARLLLILGCLSVMPPVIAGEPIRSDNRSVTVESTLQDLSRSNDAAIDRPAITPLPGQDALGQPRTDLVVQPPPDVTTVVGNEVQSGLHRLKRDTVIRQTPDDRKARVEIDRDQAAENTRPKDPGS
jgi:hypothetical protein